MADRPTGVNNRSNLYYQKRNHVKLARNERNRSGFISSGPVPEAGAVAHWLFGDDNPTFADLVAGRVATGGANQTLEAGYTRQTVVGTQLGLDSTVQAAAEQTYCLMFRRNSNGEANIIGGTLLNGGSDGSSLFYGTGNIRHNARTRQNVELSPSAPSNTEFMFVAATRSSANNEHTIFMGGSGGNTFLDAGPAAPLSTRNIGIGNIHSTLASFSGRTHIAECIIFNSVQTSAELAAIYTRSTARLAARSLPVV